MAKNKMSWEEWYYKYYPRVAKMLVAAFYLAIFDTLMLFFLVVGMMLGWV